MDFVVIQHLDIEPPALIGEVLREAGHRLQTVRTDLGQPMPDRVSAYAGAIIMGGPQSANDTHLPYIADELAWLRQAIDDGLPMLGICLGAQLMARAAGGEVTASPVRELGWYPVFPARGAASDPLFSGLAPGGLMVFQWHGETFSLPQSATLLATHPAVPAQAFRLGGGQYGLQFHVEVDANITAQWIAAGEGERAHLGEGGLAALHAQTTEHLESMRKFGRQMTRNWLSLL